MTSPAQPIHIVSFPIEGMTCASCVNRITRFLGKVEGVEEAQTDHEQEMMAMGGMKHDEPEGIAVKPDETKELTYTFAKVGPTLAGCHVTGHYGAGMKAEVTVTQ